MNWIPYVTGPLIGAVIGYFTNYLAVKMLFRPYRAVRIGKFQLPFTPGIMPKRKPDLARAIGGAVENNLLSRDDLIGALVSGETVSAVSDGVCARLFEIADSEQTLGEAADHLLGGERMQRVKQSAVQSVSGSVSQRLIEMDLGQTIADIAGKTVLEKVQGSMLAMFVTPNLVSSYAEPLREKINAYVEDAAPALIQGYIEAEAGKLAGRPLNSLVTLDEAARETVAQRVGQVYADFMREKAAELFANLHVGKMIEDKINEMDIADFEKLVLQVMKKELGMIVNLGALIGLVIGILNAFI